MARQTCDDSSNDEDFDELGCVSARGFPRVFHQSGETGS